MARLAGKFISALFLAAGAVWLAPFSFATPQIQLHEYEVIGYRGAAGNDSVSRLQRQIESGDVKLEYTDAAGYLESVLKNLRIPVSSQGLVFAKNSFQLNRISPETPRAIYFNDNSYVGWTRGGAILELGAVDPKLGGVFYALEQTRADKPRLIRKDTCLQCHASGGTRGVPGFLVRSVYPDDHGYPIAALGGRVTDHTSPLRERWGGWYVTGAHGDMRHAGNVTFGVSDDLGGDGLLTGGNLTSLESRFSTKGYLSGHSDIVALMTLEHQTQAHNLITRLGYETTLALRERPAGNDAPGRPDGGMSDSARQRIEKAADNLLRYMLFVGEATFQSPISGASGFAKEFAARGVRDTQGRSLRDLDLRTRLFRYPCSYLIYSEAFDGLPRPALEIFYRKLWLALSGRTEEKDILSISAQRRTAALEILRETKPGLPAYFQTVGK